MKTAVVYFSTNGNCAFVAKELINVLDADLIRLHAADEKPRKSAAHFFWGCKLRLSRKNPPLQPYSFNPEAYDLIIIGAPIWAGSPAPPVRTFIAEAGITGKKVALFITHTGGKRKSLIKFRALLAGNDIAAEADFNSPLKNIEETKQRIAAWMKQVKSE